MFIVATFYHFFDFPDFAEKREELKEKLLALGMKGSLLIAAEGVNATLAGTREAVDVFLAYLQNDITHAPIEHKESLYDRQPFGRLKVRLKKETISLGEKVDASKTGKYIAPADWNALIADPDMVLIDARNSYETHLGTFEGALDPHTRNFKQLPGFVRGTLDPAKHKKIATYCTGGIRCEKFSSWLLAEGFEEVYHLKGGILKYLEDVPAEASRWQGECYVFDERIAVGHGLAPSATAGMCRACGHTLTPKDRQHPAYSEGKACGFCQSTLTSAHV